MGEKMSDEQEFLDRMHYRSVDHEHYGIARLLDIIDRLKAENDELKNKEVGEMAALEASVQVERARIASLEAELKKKNKLLKKTMRYAPLGFTDVVEKDAPDTQAKPSDKCPVCDGKTFLLDAENMKVVCPICEGRGKKPKEARK